jgi:hypothetical protein
VFALPLFPAYAQPAGQESSENTPTLIVVTITVTYAEPINVRSGPSSVDYPVIGSLDVGVTARAIGRSPAGEWILIVAPEGANWAGTGWVYAPLVSLTPGFLPVIEPPPTPTPLVTATLNPTFVAAFHTAATATRLPTFTPAPPLEIPTFQNRADPSVGGFPIGLVIVLLGLLGTVGLVVASSRRR